jgi:hypothetical protein
MDGFEGKPGSLPVQGRQIRIHSFDNLGDTTGCLLTRAGVCATSASIFSVVYNTSQHFARTRDAL